jgi:hypothetical protein
MSRPNAIKNINAIPQTILRLHHDQRSQARCPIHRHHGQIRAPRLAAQAQTDTRLYQPLQPDLPCLLRTLLSSRCAIDREKEIKGWRRSKKIRLIESMNPRWEDLAKDWGNEYKPEPAADQQEIPRPLEKTRGFGMTLQGRSWNLVDAG